MKSKKLGMSTSKKDANITIHTSPAGMWLLVNDSEYFLSYKEHPWFQQAKISDIHDVQLLHETHLNWPTLDVDLELDALENPQKYPLTYR